MQLARRLVGVLAAVWAMTVLTVATALPAIAASAAAPTNTCPTPKPYPPAPHATVQASTTSPRVGQKIEVSGIHYCATESVDITIAGKHVGTAHTDAEGAFDPLVKVPGPPGQKQLCGIGASGLSNDRDCLTLNVTTGNPHGTGGTNEGPALTGVEIASLVAIGAVLLGSGVVFVSAGRRHKIAAED